MTQPQILIVDGDPTVALVTQRGLQRMLGGTAAVAIAPSLGAAWNDARLGGADLVIVDPGPLNHAALSWIAELGAAQPPVCVLVLTAYDTPGMRGRMARLGVRHYLAKPVEIVELGRVVREALNRVAAPLA